MSLINARFTSASWAVVRSRFVHSQSPSVREPWRWDVSLGTIGSMGGVRNRPLRSLLLFTSQDCKGNQKSSSIPR